MEKPKKPKAERKRDKEIVELYHKKVTEEALDPLFSHFLGWKAGTLPYYELTEHIHEFLKKKSMFNYDEQNDEFLIFQAKMDLNLLIDEEKESINLGLNLIMYNNALIGEVSIGKK